MNCLLAFCVAFRVMPSLSLNGFSAHVDNDIGFRQHLQSGFLFVVDIYISLQNMFISRTQNSSPSRIV